MIHAFSEVLQFWFQELAPQDWFRADPELDNQIRTRFQSIHEAAVRGESWFWRREPKGRLAEIIVLDQFSRNMHRGTPGAFTNDVVALVLAQEAVFNQVDREFSAAEKAFVYLPYMHSESRVIHTEAVKLFSQPGLESNLRFEMRHKDIIDQFGRYPHRNIILGRTSTLEEIEFLKKPGSSF
jgi:uncharacterized protein (DUF924 family)